MPTTPASPGASPFRPTRSDGAVHAIATDDDWHVVLDRVLATVLDERDDPPDFLFLAASSAFSDDYDELVDQAYHQTGARRLIGGSARGFLAGTAALERGPGVALLACWMPDASFQPVRIHQGNLDMLASSTAFAATSGVDGDAATGWLMFANPYQIDVQQCLMRFRDIFPLSPVIGALMSTHRQDRRVWTFLDDQVYEDGIVMLGLGAPYGLRAVVSQGASPIGEPWTITGVDRNRITHISNRPAVDVMNDHLRMIEPRLGQLPSPPLLLGFPMNEYQDAFCQGEFVVRGILGIDEETGSILTGSIPRIGQTVQFQVRDPESAEVDVQQSTVDALAMLHGGTPIGALMATCVGRGTKMFTDAAIDCELVARVMGPVPTAGMFSSGEIGPVCHVPALNSFALALGLIVREPAATS